MEINTTNDFLVGTGGDGVTVIFPISGRIPKDKALRLAAWIVALAEPDEGEFEKVLDAIRNT